jgi:hypothetical protein
VEALRPRPPDLVWVLSASGLKAAFIQADPHYTLHQWHLVTGLIVAKEAAVPIAVAVWLVLAWGNSRGRDWARVSFLAYFALATLALLADAGQHVARYDPASLAVTAAIWVVGLVSAVLIFSPKSGPYYRPAPASA